MDGASSSSAGKTNADGGAGKKRKRPPSEAKLLSVSDGTAKASAEEKRRLGRYSRGAGNNSKNVVKHRLKLGIKRGEAKIKSANKRAAQAELLLPTEAGTLEPENEMERTARLAQWQVAQAVDKQTQRKAYNMKLDKFGPYKAAFTANGRHALLAGRKGHVAVVDWESARVKTELHLKETVRDACFLRDQTMFAVAQHNHLYIYDGGGTELHCLRHHKPQVNRLAFLRYHWLLTTISSSGHLRYLDVSTGTNVADLHTRLGDCDCLRVNPWNAVVALGHANGVVTMWTPNMPQPVVKMLCHKGSLAAIAIDRAGRYMATSGRDGTLKLWDVRTYRPLHDYNTPRPATSLDISDRGMLAAVHGPSVQVFKDCLSKRANGPYMTHLLPSCECESARFVPYEDFLGIGHSKGFCSMLTPGAGEPNFDSHEADPFEQIKARREGEVTSLLEKLPAESIMLDPSSINTVERSQDERRKELQGQKDARLAELAAGKKRKKKTRGRSKAARRAAKKQSNVLDEKRQQRQAELEERRKRIKRRAGPEPDEEQGFNALGRFAAKGGGDRV